MTFAAENMRFAIVPEAAERRSGGLGTIFRRTKTKGNGCRRVVEVVDIYHIHHLFTTSNVFLIREIAKKLWKW